VPVTRNAAVKSGRRRRQLIQEVPTITQGLQQLFHAGGIDCTLGGVRRLLRRQFGTDRNRPAFTDGQRPAAKELDFDTGATFSDDLLAFANRLAESQPAQATFGVARKGCSGKSDDGRDVLTSLHLYALLLRRLLKRWAC